MLRLFVGISLPEDIRDRLRFLCAGLPGAKWADTEQMHLTLRFIGEVDGGHAEDIYLALSAVSAPSFDLVITGVDCFEQSGKVHTLWAGVDRQPSLQHLREKVESALVRVGLEPERRKFKPHITLARFRNGGSERIGSYIQTHSRFSCGPFLVEEFTLFRSHLGSGGAFYEPLATYGLAPDLAILSSE